MDDGTGSLGYAKSKNRTGMHDEASSIGGGSLLAHFASQLPTTEDLASAAEGEGESENGGGGGGGDESDSRGNYIDIGPSLPRTARGPARPPPQLLEEPKPPTEAQLKAAAKAAALVRELYEYFESKGRGLDPTTTEWALAVLGIETVPEEGDPAKVVYYI